MRGPSRQDDRTRTSSPPYGRGIVLIIEAARWQRRLGRLAVRPPPGCPVDVRQLVDEGRRDDAGRFGYREQAYGDRDFLLVGHPEDVRRRVGIEADPDVRVPPDGGEIPAPGELGEGAIARLQDFLVPDDVLVDHHEGDDDHIDLFFVERFPGVPVYGAEDCAVLRRPVDVRHGGLPGECPADLTTARYGEYLPGAGM